MPLSNTKSQKLHTYPATKVAEILFNAPDKLLKKERELIGLNIIGVKNKCLVVRSRTDAYSHEYHMSKAAVELHLLSVIDSYIDSYAKQVKLDRPLLPALSTAERRNLCTKK